MLKKLILSLLLIFSVSFIITAEPPYMWYSTYSVENYVGNGCSGGNLGTCHEDADGFVYAVQGHAINNPSYQFNRRDTACTADKFTGVTAETNYSDFIFYAGHGDGSGPFLGCGAAYNNLDSWTHLKLGQDGYLKWVQGAACQWFTPTYSGMSIWQRWQPAFQGVHVVMGHRAVTYDHSYSNQMSDTFWDYWRDSGWGISDAWLEAQIYWVYTMAGMPGLSPAAMGADSTYVNETWAAAADVKAPVSSNIMRYRVVGNPAY